MPENPLESLAAVDDVAIQGYDADRRVFYWNDASADLYGFSSEEAMGRRLEDLIVPESAHAFVVGEIADWLAGGPPPSGGEVQLRHKLGHLVSVHSNHLSLRDQNNAPRLFCIDVPTDRQRGLEATLYEADHGFTARDGTAAGQAYGNQLGDGMLASLSHEIRTPLNAILGFSELLARRLGPGLEGDPASSYFGHIETAGRDLTRVLEQSLALLGAAPVALEPRPRLVQVQDILVEVASVLLVSRPERDDLLTVNQVPGDLRATLDPFLVKQCVAALARYGLANSVGGAPVTLSARMRSGLLDMVLFQVEDAGPPLPDALRLRLLSGQPMGIDPYRAENQSSLFHLSIAQRIALATGSLLTFERTETGANRAALGVRATAATEGPSG